MIIARLHRRQSAKSVGASSSNIERASRAVPQCLSLPVADTSSTSSRGLADCEGTLLRALERPAALGRWGCCGCCNAWPLVRCSGLSELGAREDPRGRCTSGALVPRCRRSELGVHEDPRGLCNSGPMVPCGNESEIGALEDVRGRCSSGPLVPRSRPSELGAREDGLGEHAMLDDALGRMVSGGWSRRATLDDARHPRGRALATLGTYDACGCPPSHEDSLGRSLGELGTLANVRGRTLEELGVGDGARSPARGDSGTNKSFAASTTPGLAEHIERGIRGLWSPRGRTWDGRLNAGSLAL